MRNLSEIHEWVKSELAACASFWLEHGWDRINGGVYTCLDREGNIYSTDKSVWMQGRCAWTYANLCRLYGKREDYMAFSKSCLDFLEEHCVNREAGGRLYFTVTSDGKPLRQRRYNFSEGFYAIANAEYYGLTGEDQYLERARNAYEMIYKLNNGLIEDPAGLGPKTIAKTRSGLALANPMIYLNVTSIMRRVDPKRAPLYDERSRECCDIITKYHVKYDLGCTLETVCVDGAPMLDISSGRVVNPGHDIECAWFLMEEANHIDDKGLYNTAKDIFDMAFNAGWDDEYQGLKYFIDCLGKPPESYEHDMKLWWPHNEILIASIMLYRDLKDEKYLDIFLKTCDYCKKYFCDPEYGEWFGYLRRDGLPTEPPCKGSTFKGPFHIPRCLMMVDKILDQLEAE
ncbi:MAG: AGE family epimerase/isomerase [Clostridia bacterium]|nr:AGE family epimerase/isomerase [Clostridia bacterium]